MKLTGCGDPGKPRAAEIALAKLTPCCTWQLSQPRSECAAAAHPATSAVAAIAATNSLPKRRCVYIQTPFQFVPAEYVRLVVPLELGAGVTYVLRMVFR
jgi:hypothetical protein